MSKRDLKKYLAELDKPQLEEQIIDLYDKFSDIKTYYNFVFNPKEKNLLRDAKLKISNEYFPIRGKRPKMRRSVAQKFIKHFIVLGVDDFAIADAVLRPAIWGDPSGRRGSARHESSGLPVRYGDGPPRSGDFRHLCA